MNRTEIKQLQLYQKFTYLVKTIFRFGNKAKSNPKQYFVVKMI